MNFQDYSLHFFKQLPSVKKFSYVIVLDLLLNLVKLTVAFLTSCSPLFE